MGLSQSKPKQTRDIIVQSHKNPFKNSIETDGVLASLTTSGIADTMFPEYMPDYILKNTMYRSIYTEIPTKMEYSSMTVKLSPIKKYDMIDDVDLVFPNPNKLSLHDIGITMIEVYSGGQLFDILGMSGDIEMEIKTNCELLCTKKRGIEHVNGMTYVPLAMALLHENDMVVPTNIYIQIIGPKIPYGLYGNVYYTDNRDEILSSIYCFSTTQNQTNDINDITYAHADTITTIKIPLKFNHLLRYMYFWGFDPTKVKNIKLIFNNTYVYYDGSIGPLERAKRSRGHDTKTTVMYFPGGINAPGTIIDTSELIIETFEGEVPVHVMGLTTNQVICSPVKKIITPGSKIFEKNQAMAFYTPKKAGSSPCSTA